MDLLLGIIVGLLIVFQALDVLTSLVTIQARGIDAERNPAMRWFLNLVGVRKGLIVKGAVFSLIFLAAAETLHPDWAVLILAAVLGWYAYWMVRVNIPSALSILRK